MRSMSWGVFNCMSRGEGEGMIDEKHVLGGGGGG